MRKDCTTLTEQVGYPLNLSKIAEKIKGYKAADAADFNLKANKHFFGYLLIVNADPKRYGALQRQYQTLHLSTGIDHYPESIDEAMEKLNQCKPPKSNHKHSKTQRDKNQSSEKESTDDTPALSFLQQSEGKCHCCGKEGHHSRNCRQKKPKDEWWFYKEQAKQQQQQSQSPQQQSLLNAPQSVSLVPPGSVMVPPLTTPSPGSSVMHMMFCNILSDNEYSFLLAQQLREVIIIDNASTCNLFCNDKMLHNIRAADLGVAVNTNGGPFGSMQVGTLSFYGDVWYNPKGIANILSQDELEKTHLVTYDHVNHNYTVHKLNNGKDVVLEVCHWIVVLCPTRNRRTISISQSEGRGDRKC